MIRGWSAAGAADAARRGAAARVFGARSAAARCAKSPRDMLALARGGLARRARRDARGRDETVYLAPLDAIVESGAEPARVWLERFEGPWGGSVDPVFAEARI